MRRASHRRRRPPVAVLLVTVLLAAGTGVAALLASGVAAADDPRPVSAPILVDPEPEPAGASGAPGPADSEPPAGLAVLREWDADRSAAWAAGDLDALAALYVPGSAVGRRDVAALQAYVDRDLRVEGLTTQLLTVDPRRGPRGTLTVRVTDRLAGGQVVGPTGTTALPTSDPVRRELTWRRVDGRWLMARVREVSGPRAR